MRLAAPIAAGLMFVAAALPAQDTSRTVRIGLTYAAGTRPGVIVLPIPGLTGDSVRTIIQRDLDYGDRIAIVAADSASASGLIIATAGPAFDYAFFAKIGAAAVVRLTPTARGLHLAIHDVGAARVAMVKDYDLPSDARSPDWRLAVHRVADDIEAAITGTRGIAATRILFVRDRQIVVIDSDGAAERVLVSGGSPLSPTWHPSGRSIAYTTFGDRGTVIAVRDLATGRTRTLVATPGGLNITPVFSPDGKSVVYAHGLDDGTDLIIADPSTNARGRQITVGRGTDNVSPTFSPDGRRLAFTSGRSGHPEVYIMDADGTNVELLTPFRFGDQSYRSSPDWSPDNRSIAFQAQMDGRFQVMTISLRDRSIRQLTSEAANEDPSWAPDGRHLVFASTRSGVKQLWVMDVESGRVRQLTRTGGARLGAWSPPLTR